MGQVIFDEQGSTARRGLLARVRRDQSGNTLAMAAIAMIPLSAMIGSGMDMSRTYLVKARLQSACDAGALAARKTMDASGTLGGSPTTQGNNFFNNNFPVGTYGVTSTSFAMQLDSEKQVIGTASTIVPMSLMKMFGFETMTVAVTCSARLDITNTDVMFVLDTTGSMGCIPSDINSTGDCSGNASSKIVGLRSAVVDFYSSLTTSAPPTAQIRFGFVPYSSTVNVGALLPSSYINNTANYRSLRANFTTPVYLGTPGAPTPTTETYGSLLDATQCNAYGSNIGYPALNGSSSNTGTAPANTTQTNVSFKDWGVTGTTTGTTRTCRRNKTTTVTTYVTKYKLTDFSYGSIAMDASSWKTGTSIAVATGTPSSTDYSDTSTSYNLVQLAALPTYTGTQESNSWDGCIEERDTVSNSTFSYGSIPAAAYDLDIDLVPSNTATSWRAKWPQLVWDPNGGSPSSTWANRANGYYACPARAQKLQVMTQAQVQSYVDGLTVKGGTYHDTGMIWGARLISPTGIFGSENQPPANGQPIARNIVFMTDGMMAPNQNIDGMYGYEALDQRITGGTPNAADLTNRHNSRFVAMCNAARAKNVRIWVVAFGQTLNSQLTSCADPGQAFYASNTATLRAQFTAIATKIAKLRLSQ